MNAKSYSAPFCSDEVENERSAACLYVRLLRIWQRGGGDCFASLTFTTPAERRAVPRAPRSRDRSIYSGQPRARRHYYSLTFLSLRSR